MNPIKAYKETQVRTASQGQLIVMLYDEGIKQVGTAASLLQAENPQIEMANNSLIRAQDVVTELMVSLDFEKGGEMAHNLFSLYLFFNRQLLEANLKKDPRPLVDLRSMLVELRDAWAQISGKPGPPSSDGGPGVNIAG